ncbi:MAG: CHC2 zinc finger domain-containing protein [Chloroflexota bacterium]|nr:CHC2 zinc finger domain-containing protein [Chloroflexota bacterium]MDE2684622.1 CHC2 zinc finger domain-containing protein [Chloroflexota bacterium]
MVVANSAVDYAELKARNPLGDAVEAAGVVLHGKGRVRQGVCPFHQETEGSFTVYANTEKFWCFGCGAGGDVLDFVGRMEGLTLPEVIRRLDDGSTPSPRAPSHRPTPAQRPTAISIPPRDPALLTAAVRFYGGQLRRSSAALQYLASRGIGPDAALRLGLGYAPDHGLREHLQASGFTNQRQRDSGLFLERGKERFAGTITVPDLAQGRARWLTGRAIQPNARPRFQALPGSKPVLGLAALGPAPSGVIVAEGVFDWLTLAGWGYPAVAALGTQGMDKVAAALRGCPRIFLAFDNDDAGNTAAQELKQLLGNRAAVVNLPHGVGDLGELATRPNGNLIFRRLLAHAANAAR